MATEEVTKLKEGKDHFQLVKMFKASPFLLKLLSKCSLDETALKGNFMDVATRPARYFATLFP